MSAHLTYLLLELGWSLPVLGLHWVLGGRLLWRRRRAVLLATIVPAVYLSLADAFAIQAGIWAINPARTLDLRAGGLVLEEILFFFLSSLMVVQSLFLFLDAGVRDSAWRRLRHPLSARVPAGSRLGNLETHAIEAGGAAGEE